MTTLVSENISKAAQKDIEELQNKISKFKSGGIEEERFKAFRLTRGVYGQRQFGVQMFRIKVPYGRITPEQLTRIGQLSREYTNGNLHLTTRQNIQLHYVRLDDTPEMWEKMEEVGITTREACGNTVRNITASSLAGIDPEEPFDVAPYAEAVFKYFLRNPICQEMGRKIKMAFSSSERDSAFTFLHDFGFIPVLRGNQRGFKVVVGGGLGAQSMVAKKAFEFLSEKELIPFIEAALRVFDRYGEREKRFKARLKFLVNDKALGLQAFLKLVEEERNALPNQQVEIDTQEVDNKLQVGIAEIPDVAVDEKEFDLWKQTNVIQQKQPGFYAVNIRVPLGNISSETAYELADLAAGYASNDIRITVGQGLLFKYVREEALKYIFYRLSHLNLHLPGADTIVDVTACPGTDTCNLGVTNSTGVAQEIEQLINEDFKHLISDSLIAIKISGCMNSCGQHMIANIGFHGSSIKNEGKVIPALQIVLGGGIDGQGKHSIADKVIKLPSKRVIKALKSLLTDYESKSTDGEYFNDYYRRQGKRYFYALLKPYADLEFIEDEEYVDWGHNEQFVPEIGTGECAGVSLDVVGTIILDAEEKLYYAKEALDNEAYTDSAYNSYNAMVVAAKALLLSEDIRCNTHIGIIQDFDKHFVSSGPFVFIQSFENQVLQINRSKPDKNFVNAYYTEAEYFVQQVKAFREKQVAGNTQQKDKQVVSNFYKA